ncbi:MAG TPA: DoxX family protein [Caulobacteraceae bacterium]|nr:DoxX family protein [Caulobacteraceae bacterium]
MTSATNAATAPATAPGVGPWTGRVLSGLTIVFLILDSGMKLLDMPQVRAAMRPLDYPAYLARPIGEIELTCLVLYAIPRTAPLGAILLTGLLGGAIASHLRVGDPLISHVLFGVYVGLMAWGGLYLRDEKVRALIPWRR